MNVLRIAPGNVAAFVFIAITLAQHRLTIRIKTAPSCDGGRTKTTKDRLLGAVCDFRVDALAVRTSALTYLHAQSHPRTNTIEYTYDVLM